MSETMHAFRVLRVLFILTRGRTERGDRHVGLRVVWLGPEFPRRVTWF